MQKELSLLNQAHWEQRYDEGVLPWDSGITPPEVVAFWQSNSVPVSERQGKFAVDLGCGTGTNVAYLANLGLRVLGVELAGKGLTMAQERLRLHENSAKPSIGGPTDSVPRDDRHSRIGLVQASVTALPFDNIDPIYVLDIGCFHTIHPDLRAAYAKDVSALLAPGGYFHLYGFDWIEARANDPDKTPRGFRQTEVADLFAPSLDVVTIEQATANPHPCRWYLLQKRVIDSDRPKS